VYDDLKANVPFASSYIKRFNIISEDSYLNFKNELDGDHNETKMRESVESIVKEAVFREHRDVENNMGKGTLMPLSIDLASDKIVYPFKISSINKGDTETLLYVMARYRTKTDNKHFKTEFAGWLEDAVKKISIPNYYGRKQFEWLKDISGKSGKGYFITKFRCKISADDIKDDVYIKRAENDDEYRITVLEKNFWLYLAIFIAVFIFGLIVVSIVFLIGFMAVGPLFNRFVHNNKESILYMTDRRCMINAVCVSAGLLLLFLFMLLISSISGENALLVLRDSILWIFTILYNVLHFVGVPAVLNYLISFIVYSLIILYSSHLFCGALILVYRKIRPVKNDRMQSSAESEYAESM